ncbi:MAG: ATP-binding protein [Actinomycetota bacterium]
MDSGTTKPDTLEFVSRVTDAALLRIEEKLPHGFVRLKVAEAERRQAQHDIRSVEDIVSELVRNSRDAGASHVLVAFQKEKNRYRRVTVLDDGCGIPPDMHEVVFEPRVTSKSDDFEEDCFGVHGRGMALFSIRSRCQEARINWSVPGIGTSVSAVIDTEVVGERADQATMPALVDGDEGRVVGTGPHNVLRALLELSVDREGTAYYVGSFAEILATARGLGRGGSPGIWSELASPDDARLQAELCSRTFGLKVSERNAYRVLGGEIAPVIDVHGMAGLDDPDGIGRPDGTAREVAPRRRAASNRGRLLCISGEHLQRIGEDARQAADRVLEGYYLKSAGPPRVRRGKGKLTVTFFVSEEDER